MTKGETRGLEFAGRSFCFTGKLADLKRSAAERETRARGGLTSKVVNGQLDYLVVGSIPATGWKHGSYGTKIEKARRMAPKNDDRPLLVPESAFVEALALVSPTNSGAIDAKVLVVTYKFVAADEHAFDRESVEDALASLRRDLGCHVSVRANLAATCRDLYGDDTLGTVPGTYLVIETRFVRQMALDDDCDDTVDAIERTLETVDGVDGSARWFERTEGSTDYVRLLREIPESLRVPSL